MRATIFRLGASDVAGGARVADTGASGHDASVRRWIVLLLGLVACGSSGTLVREAPDGGGNDATGATDGLRGVDTGSEVEAGVRDAEWDADAATTTACGSLGERCCSGGACAGALVCTDGACGSASSSECPAAGTCSSGRCLVTIASNQSAPYLLSAGATHVSWANWTTYSFTGQVAIPGSVVTAPVDGGASRLLYAGDIGEWWTGFTSDPENVYWNGGGMASGIVRTDLAGGPTQLLATVYCWALAVDDTSVYCTSGEFGKTQTVTKVPLGGGAPVMLDSSTQHSALGIVARGGNVYWNAGDVIEGISAAGGAPTTIASGVAGSAIAINSMALYWQTDAGIGTAPLSGGAPTTVAVSMSNVKQMAVDDVYVYWTDATDGTVMKAPLAGGTPTTLYAGDLPYAIAVDDRSVYWTSPSGGTVMRLTPK